MLQQHITLEGESLTCNDVIGTVCMAAILCRIRNQLLQADTRVYIYLLSSYLLLSLFFRLCA